MTSAAPLKPLPLKPVSRNSALRLIFASPAMLAFIVIDTVTQVVFKWASAGLDETAPMLDFALAIARSPAAWLGIGCYALTFLAWMAVLHRLPLSTAFPLTASTYITVPLAAWALFGERMNLMQGGAVVLIIAGLVLIGSGENHEE